MKTRQKIWLLLLIVALWTTTAIAGDGGPTVVATIPLGEPAGAGPFAAAVNANTNTIYVTNPGSWSSPDFGEDCDSHDVSVINGSTNTASNPITVGLNPFGLAVNPKTSRIYVANIGGVGSAPCTSEESYSQVPDPDTQWDWHLAKPNIHCPEQCRRFQWSLGCSRPC